MATTRTITNSELRCFWRCPREHHYRYELRYRARQDFEALRFGTLIHAGLEAWFSAPDLDSRLDYALGALVQHTIAHAGIDDFELARANALMCGYDARWRDAPLITLAVEHVFRAPLVNPDSGQPARSTILAGKLDALVQDERSRVLILEHKTSSEDVEPGSHYWQHLALDSQVSIYFAGVRAEFGFDPDGCLYDVIAKPTIRPLRATAIEARKYTKSGALYAKQRAEDESPAEYELRLLEHITANPDRYYQRGPVVRLESEMIEAGRDVWHSVRLIRALEQAEFHPRNTDACFRFGRPCSYFDVCTGVAELTDPARYVQLTDPHPELAEPERNLDHAASESE